MAERRKIIRQRQMQEEEEILTRQEEERLVRQEEERQNAFRNDNRDFGFRRDLREIGGNPRRIRNNDEPITPSAPPLSEIAEDLSNERRMVTADYFPPNLSGEKYDRAGFPPLKENETIVSDLNYANFIEHITVDGKRKLYNARNFRLDKFDPENLLEAKDITDESIVDPDNVIKIQLEALRTGGSYRFIYKKPDITTRTGGAFLWFLKEEFPFSLSKYGIYKKSEWKKLKDIEIFNSCLVHCFKDHPNYERVLYSKASIYTLCSKKYSKLFVI